MSFSWLRPIGVWFLKAIIHEVVKDLQVKGELPPSDV